MKIGNVELASPFAIAPMAGMTDTAFRRLVKRQGGCGLVVSEMVSSEGLIRGIDRTLEFADFTEEERPVSIQIFGGDPATMAEAARIVEGMGADIVDVNMGCPVPKIAKHNAGCSLMREPGHAAAVIEAMTRAVDDPGDREDARRVERYRSGTRRRWRGWSRTPAPRRWRCTAGPPSRATAASADWDHRRRHRRPPEHSGVRQRRLRRAGAGGRQAAIRGVDGVLVGRGVLRNPWILAQAADLAAGRPVRPVTLEDRGRFLLDYIDLLMHERVRDDDAGGGRSHDRWVINKLRALGAYYTKGFEQGRSCAPAINTTTSLAGSAAADRRVLPRRPGCPGKGVVGHHAFAPRLRHGRCLRRDGGGAGSSSRAPVCRQDDPPRRRTAAARLYRRAGAAGGGRHAATGEAATDLAPAAPAVAPRRNRRQLLGDAAGDRARVDRAAGGAGGGAAVGDHLPDQAPRQRRRDRRSCRPSAGCRQRASRCPACSWCAARAVRSRRRWASIS